MKFGLYILKNSVPEWKDFYINYHELKSILKVFEVYYKKQCTI